MTALGVGLFCERDVTSTCENGRGWGLSQIRLRRVADECNHWNPPLVFLEGFLGFLVVFLEQAVGESLSVTNRDLLRAALQAFEAPP
jgi:hypothetical protein